jgi:hypothetical protein
MRRKLHNRSALRGAFWLLCGALWVLPVLASDVPIQDPTRPVNFVAPKTRQTPEQSLRLQAIFLGQGRAEAVINGRRLQPGDTVNQARIIAIHPGRVVYERDGAHAELILRPAVTRPVGGEE